MTQSDQSSCLSFLRQVDLQMASVLKENGKTNVNFCPSWSFPLYFLSKVKLFYLSFYDTSEIYLSEGVPLYI